MIYVLMVSGGKDSTALWAWAKRSGLAPRIQLTQDTGWEFNGTPEIQGWRAYLMDTAMRLGEAVTIVSAETQFEPRVRKYNTFPGNVSSRRWCTKELKIEPARRFIDELRDETGDEVVVVVGVRADESPDRAVLPEREWSECGGKGIIRKLVPTPIREMVAWARTSHGGKRLAMFPEPSGCARWGICEAPARTKEAARG